MRNSFQLAFAEDLTVVNRIQGCTTMNDFEAFSPELALHRIIMYFIIDQINALDANSEERMSAASRIQLSETLGRLTFSHFFIQSGSANFEIAIKAYLTQEHVDNIEPHGGLDDEEWEAWWKRYTGSIPSLSLDFKEAIEDMSGRNPLLLRAFKKAVKLHLAKKEDMKVKERIQDNKVAGEEESDIVDETQLWEIIQGTHE
ncbi:hypothetical protein BDZ91DRAFT_67342 [Kalaharituber pfeilii]|nr:hypothetical protein BDZ91DRAFT_67342 [Kalaharituber pfeilii]